MRSPTLGPLSRGLTALLAVLFGVLGLILFLAPGWASEVFAWAVSPFVVMTMGGWCLGNAVFAGLSAKVWRWSTVNPGMVYLWAFSVLQLLVLLAFADRLRLGHPLAWLYVAALGVGVLSAVTGVVDLVRLRPAWTDGEGRRYPVLLRAASVVFVVALTGLAIGGGLVAKQGGLSTEGGIFPEPLSLFTVRALAAFFAALAIGAVPLVFARSVQPFLHFLWGGLTLIVPIMIAAAVYASSFDLSARRGGLAYLGAYGLVGVFTVVVLAAYLIRGRPAAAR